MKSRILDLREKPSECFTDCLFCGNLITKKRKGFMFKVAEFVHWDCLLQLRKEIDFIEKSLSKAKAESEK